MRVAYAVLFVAILAIALVTSNREDSNFARLTEQIGGVSQQLHIMIEEIKKMDKKPFVQLVEPPKPHKKVKPKSKVILVPDKPFFQLPL